MAGKRRNQRQKQNHFAAGTPRQWLSQGSEPTVLARLQFGTPEHSGRSARESQHPA